MNDTPELEASRTDRPDALVEVEQAHGRFRIALRYSDAEADFLWLSREQAAGVASELCALIPGLPTCGGHPVEAVAAALAAAQYCNVNWDQQIDGAASVALAVLDAAAPLIVAAERERCQALIRDLAASWRDSAIKAPDPDVAAEFEYVASAVDAAADSLDGAT